MSYLEYRGKRWYAKLTIPADVRDAIGRGIRFFESTGTSDRALADIIASKLVADWKIQIRQARGQTNPLHLEAIKWKRELSSKKADPYQKAIAEEFLVERTRAMEQAKGADKADEFLGLVEGTRRATNDFYEQWKARIELAPKTKDQMVKDVGLMIAKFPTLEGITKSAVRGWVEQLQDEGKGDSSIKRILSFCRNYWKYLDKHGAVSRDAPVPFDGVFDVPKKKKRKTTNLPYEPSDVVKLWEAASVRRFGKAKDSPFDTQLADLIKLGAYTGARIEELCSVKVEKVTDKVIKIEDAKTLAGWREVPIHSAIAPLVKRLKKESEDGYLLSGLTFNKYGDRSNAIGKRFGRLKEDEGFTDTHTFHSFRATVATLLDNAGVSENTAADIVGHEKPRITYGLYSGGATFEVKKEALEKVSYPFPTNATK